MKRILLIVSILALVLVPAVAQEDEGTPVSLWVHSGQSEERTIYDDMIDEFNASQDEWFIEREVVPGGSYNDQVQAAALAGELPCVLDFDGPFIYNYVFSGDLMPLDDFANEELLSDVLPSIIDQGTVNDQLWSLGQFDSGLSLYANKGMLEEAGIRIPESTDDPWTLDEFNAAVEALAEVVPEDGRVFEPFMNRTGEWYSYALGPLLRSFGGDTIDKETFETAEGILNGPEGVAFGEWFQNLFEEGYATSNPIDPEIDFVEGRVALAYSGHWDYVQFSEGLGEDFIVLPMPDMGAGAVTGMGSWNWGITTGCENPEGAWAFIEFAMSPEQVESITLANGAPPALLSVLAEDERYAEGGDLYIYTQQLESGVAIPRAATAAYPSIQTAMSDLAQALARGEDVQDSLDAAVDIIDGGIAALPEGVQ